MAEGQPSHAVKAEINASSLAQLVPPLGVSGSAARLRARGALRPSPDRLSTTSSARRNPGPRHHGDEIGPEDCPIRERPLVVSAEPAVTVLWVVCPGRRRRSRSQALYIIVDGQAIKF